jgi:hypothetical protein
MCVLPVRALLAQATPLIPKIEVVPQSDWWFKWYVIFTGIIAILNFFMLLAIKRQRKVMTGQLEEMKAAREQTVAEMQSAGNLTHDLIVQAESQVRALQIAAQAAKDSAEAAKQSAEALINSERSWIIAELVGSPLYKHRSITTEQDGQTTTMSFTLVCSNHGKTVAWITEKMVGFKVIGNGAALPSTPDLAPLQIVQVTPEPVGIRESTKVGDAFTFEGVQGIGDMVVVYGVVKYRDVFGDDYRTVFGYRLTLNDTFERLSGYPEYNKNT